MALFRFITKNHSRQRGTVQSNIWDVIPRCSASIQSRSAHCNLGLYISCIVECRQRCVVRCPLEHCPRRQIATSSSGRAADVSSRASRVFPGPVAVRREGTPWWPADLHLVSRPSSASRPGLRRHSPSS